MIEKIPAAEAVLRKVAPARRRVLAVNCMLTVGWGGLGCKSLLIDVRM